MKIKGVLKIVFLCAMPLLTIAHLFFVNYLLAFGITLSAVGTLSLVFLDKWIDRGLVFLCVVFELVFMLSNVYIFFIISTCFYLVATSYLLIKEILRLRKTLYKALTFACQGMACALCFLMILTAITPNVFVGAIQLFSGASNSFTADKSTQEIVTENGHLYINDIQYDSEYPNGFLDIYVSNNDKTTTRPTVVMVHGGGYVLSDKAGELSDFYKGYRNYAKFFLDNGLNYVSIDYAFAPEYSYPTPLIQLSRAVEYLKQDSVKTQYGIDMSSVIFTGVSAGGNIVGQFVNVQTNPSYAQELQIQPVISSASIKGVIFNSALLDNERFSKTGDVFYDYMFEQYGRAYFKCNSLTNNIAVKRTNVIENLTSDFPPCYISDGNYATFILQAKELYDKATRLGITAVFNDHAKTPNKVMHAYEVGFTKEAQENIQKLRTFLLDLGLII